MNKIIQGNLKYKKQTKKHEHILWKCWNAHNQQWIVVGESRLRYNLHDPSDAAHVLLMEMCCMKWRDELWLCDLTMQIIPKIKIAQLQ